MTEPSTLTHLEVEHARIIHGEALAAMRGLAARQFDALITDPPYCSGGTTTTERTSRTAPQKYVSTDSASGHAMPDFDGDQRDQRSYTLWCTLWLGEVLRLVRSGGQALVFTDWRQLPALSDALQAAGGAGVESPCGRRRTRAHSLDSGTNASTCCGHRTA
ncbi:hypothetical protein [Nocardia lijiangensis]|uniref:hypothetical protein n=1 Tax=Nocardia lijiangensis TaxID=299618 RepID=UPI00082B998F|nr:hypothetical protein [Nocardia lijiangensis]